MSNSLKFFSAASYFYFSKVIYFYLRTEFITIGTYLVGEFLDLDLHGLEVHRAFLHFPPIIVQQL